MLVNCANGAEWTYTQVTLYGILQQFRNSFQLFKYLRDLKAFCLYNSKIGDFLFKVEEYSNRVANYFHSLGYIKGDSMAFFMENRPEYIATWLGLAKIGVTPALINYNLRQQSLIRTIQVANCKAIIYGIEVESGKKHLYLFAQKVTFKQMLEVLIIIIFNIIFHQFNQFYVFLQALQKSIRTYVMDVVVHFLHFTAFQDPTLKYRKETLRAI